ncbi:HypC/HybG/HupF family hydrogenase formation chaperone [Desulfothermobacter acidiphilus]|uniref:HypC/HybG/HupF family hydrogenase formation chaperone n=1 Tax=Desulfothermobacter acidiphilus TaxID=1938353 RepID=UPI003F89E0B5
MCLGIPGRVVEVHPEEYLAVIETFGVRQRISTFLLGEVAVGEYVMVHAGYAIEKIDLEEAQERLKLWEEILKHADVGETERPGDRA